MNKRFATYAGFSRKLQGFGLMWEYNGPYADRRSTAIELRLLWFKAWIVYYLK